MIDTKTPAVSFWDIVVFCLAAIAPGAIVIGLGLWLAIWIIRTHLGWGG